MRQSDMVSSLFNKRINRRSLLAGTAATGLAAGLGLRGGTLTFAQEKNGIIWVSPRGTLEVLDDYPYWVATKMGYFGDMQNELLPAIMEATSSEKAVADGSADMSYVSPGVFTFGIEAGMNLVSAFQMGAADVFDIALPKGSEIKTIADLAGKTIILGDAGWSGITDPMLLQGGCDPSTVKYVAAGATWAQALAEGQGDAALCWAGLRAQWKAQGLDFDYIIGMTWSKFPANSFQIRKADFEDAALADLYTRYLRGWAMGLEFGHQNPRAAVQITMESEPIAGALNETFAGKLDVAVESMWQLHDVFRGNWAERPMGWGEASLENWQLFLDIAQEAGNLSSEHKAEDIIKNDYIAGANDFDHDQVKADATGFALSADFAALAEPEGAGS